MIEKFSDEELRQIKIELGIAKTDMRKTNVFRAEKSMLEELWNEKPFMDSRCVFNAIDIALCNVKEYTYGVSKGKYGTSVIVKEEDIGEYRQMFLEILEIIKKHNRKWEGDRR